MSLCKIYDHQKKQDNADQISLSIRQNRADHFEDIHVRKRGTSWYIRQKASLTVEAAVVLPLFVCFLVFVLYFFRVLQVQADVAQALQYAGRISAAGCGVQDGEDNGSLLQAGILFRKQLERQNCPMKYIHRGAAGISLLQSDLSGDYVELKAMYQMKFPVRLLGDIKYRIVQEAKCRKWTGYHPGQDAQEDDGWLYYTEHGTVYHGSHSCAYLDLSIHGVPAGQVSQKRNKSGGKYYTCEICGSGTSSGNIVYITDYGDRCHSSLTCSGLKRTVYMIRRSEATGKRMCKKCGG